MNNQNQQTTILLVREREFLGSLLSQINPRYKTRLQFIQLTQLSVILVLNMVLELRKLER